MKRTLASLMLVAILGCCCTTTITATPEITAVQGGLGIHATVADADQYNWRIELIGIRVFRGEMTEGVVNGNGSVTIRTPILLSARGFGIIDVEVTLLHHWLPVDMEKRSAFMLGPFILIIQ
jgi:hypothetical protein